MLADRRNPFASNRYGRPGYDGTCLEFMWVLLLAFSSKGTYDSIDKFFSAASPDTFAYPQGSVGTPEQMTTFFTCFMQVISCSVLTSRKVWKKGFINVARKNKQYKVQQIGDLGLFAILVMSGVKYSIQFFGMIGVDPKPKWFLLDTIPELKKIVSSDNSVFMNRLGGDLVVLYTTAFCLLLSIDYERVGTQRQTRSRIYHSTRIDFPQEDVDVILMENAQGDLVTNENVNIGGKDSYDLRRDGTVGSMPCPNLCEVCSGPYLGSQGKKYTHRMHEFVPVHRRDDEHDESRMPENEYFSLGIFEELLEK